MTNEDTYDLAFGPKNPNSRKCGWSGDTWVMPEDWYDLDAEDSDR